MLAGLPLPLRLRLALGRTAAAAVALALALFCLPLLAGCPGPEEGGRRPELPRAAGQLPGEAELEALRQEMVRRQIAARGIRDTAVLRVMGEVPRHLFVPEAHPADAYSDRALAISHGQTISQPYIVAFMAEAARLGPGDRVLEIGTGSGYGAAVLAGLAAQVYSVEIIPELAQRAREALARTGYETVEVLAGNGWLGWPEHAPYDAIVVTAAPPEIPPALVEQLAPGGLLVIPVGKEFQLLRVLRKTPRGLVEEASLPVLFVPMVGRPRDTLSP